MSIQPDFQPDSEPSFRDASVSRDPQPTEFDNSIPLPAPETPSPDEAFEILSQSEIWAQNGKVSYPASTDGNYRHVFTRRESDDSVSIDYALVNIDNEPVARFSKSEKNAVPALAAAAGGGGMDDGSGGTITSSFSIASLDDLADIREIFQSAKDIGAAREIEMFYNSNVRPIGDVMPKG